MGGIFWILDEGATWKDLPRHFGSKSTAHRWFQRWVNDGVFEAIMRNAGRCVQERDGYRLSECFIDATERWQRPAAAKTVSAARRLEKA